MHRVPRQLSIAMIAGVLVLAGCGPAQQSAGSGGPGPAAAPAAPKILKFAIGQEPSSWDTRITKDTGSPSAGGIGNMDAMAQDTLRRPEKGGGFANMLAAEVPEVARGTWVVNADSTMDMTWKIVPNAKWHDGTPVTSADFEFAVRVRNDPEAASLPTGVGYERLLTGLTVRDDTTFVSHWKGLVVAVNSGVGLIPLPKHLLDAPYQANKAGLGEHRYFTTEYVGNGPFKLTVWERGSHIDFARFDDYYKGPAKLDRVIIQIVPDPNTMIASILAGAVDVLAPPNVDITLGLEIKERWERERSGNQVVVQTRDGADTWELMLNPQYARPVNGLTQQPVRQALLQAVDRKNLVEVMTSGLSEITYVFYHQDHPAYPFVSDLDPKNGNPRFEYPYDVRRATELLAQAGWTKGADGILAHQPSGERFDYQVMTRRGDGPFRQASIIQDYYKTIGVNLNIEVLTPANQDNNEYLATRSGASYHTATTANVIGRRAHSGNIPSPATRWTGNNRGHYSNPVVDALVEKIEVTIDERQARELHRELLATEMTDIPSHYFYWVVVPILMLDGITGPRLVGQEITGNIWEWDKK